MPEPTASSPAWEARKLVSGPLPLNVMVGPGAPSVASLAQVGVVRVSVGSAIAQAAYGLVTRAARELLSDGTYTSMNDSLGYRQLNEMLQLTPR
jgi:2-methylisocitrate lyase-like PEP mutase family enzyme